MAACARSASAPGPDRRVGPDGLAFGLSVRLLALDNVTLPPELERFATEAVAAGPIGMPPSGRGRG